jgi:hypothetical protein
MQGGLRRVLIFFKNFTMVHHPMVRFIPLR